ncbi:hypothetical protein H4R99_001231 [Coemansia sp. RSA 1722]|nr:hypothetical protein LPJ57_000577 [Coemansia sp. RSA 486]KAJ2237019.1 hypothetical protein IWW45_001303 [Coemansia sp. RSA 485]KAJ2603538.1 hypothetical protein GGF39_000031 [Coemansia sp. RSA 1721]KAJ2605314.1 hypothetical protein H4R99_001231 [Coemansia sp. RSA 1722]KAJ2638688.1 hypothetical protein GGF40_001464 [Coemansia sp. RSA 1286]
MSQWDGGGTQPFGSQAPSQGGSGPQVQLQSRLQGVRNDIQNASDIIDQAMRFCTVAALDLEGFKETDGVKQMDTVLRSLIDTQHHLAMDNTLITRAATQLDSESAEAVYSRKYESECKKYRKKSEAEKYGKSEAYRNFRQQLWDLTHEGEAMPGLFSGGGADDDDEDDDDLVIAGTKVTYKCPITATWLIEPMTSKVCKHSYSREAILGYIRSQRGSGACPVGGCVHRITAKDLFADSVLERKVANHLRQLEEQESAATYTMVQ